VELLGLRARLLKLQTPQEIELCITALYFPDNPTGFTAINMVLDLLESLVVVGPGLGPEISSWIVYFNWVVVCSHIFSLAIPNPETIFAKTR